MVSVVIPIYKNKDTLRELSSRLSEVLGGLDQSYEIIFVDDACPDGSLEELRKIAEEDNNIGVISFKNNMGQHKAVLEGLRAVKGDIIAVMDGDLQDDPKTIPLLLEALRDNDVEAVFAGRKGVYQSFFRMFCSKIFKVILYFMCRVPKDAGLFLVMKKGLANKITEFKGDRLFIVSMIGCLGASTLSVPVVRDRRVDGRSAYGTWGRIVAGFRALSFVFLWKATGGRYFLGGTVKDGSVKEFYGAPFKSVN